ncbi:MAG: AEC family transporter [Bacteriovorax sp.]|nr:AEC family transporter [Bacteriovorax sp.]
MDNFIVIFVCLLAGFFCKRLKNFPASSGFALNSFIIHLSLPALILSQVPNLIQTLDFHGRWWLPVSMPWLTFLFSFLFFVIIGKKLNWTRAKIGALILTAGLGNTSFVGFPILEALIGPHAIPIGVMVDQPGTFLVLSTLGIIVASFFSGVQVSLKVIAKKIFSFPPFIALIISIIWVLTGFKGSEVLAPAFNKIASTLVPLALFTVGFQLSFDFKILKKRAFALSLGLSFKLLFLPAIFSYLYIKILNAYDLTVQVTIIESAMATMITSAIVATEFNLDTELANLMVGIGIPLSLISVPIWNYFLFVR